MKVHVPTPLRSYTNKQGVIVAAGSTVEELLADIERRYPGFRFRIIDEQGGIREHIKIFVNEDPVRTLSIPCHSTDVIHIICALSGGQNAKNIRATSLFENGKKDSRQRLP